jgi:FAD/FMN-containing dehydrogenase
LAAFAITHPVATVARAIEDIVITGSESEYLIVKAGCAVLSRAISLSVFPIFLLIELTFKRIPKLILAIGNWQKFNSRLDKVAKFASAIFTSPLGIHSPEGVSGFFLKSPSSAAVRPFGVEEVYGRQVDQIFYPKSVDELRAIVQQAKSERKQISVIGAGMCQGPQTVPQNGQHTVINLKHLNQIALSPDRQTVEVGAGATWEQLQLALNSHAKSAIVKQASDIFSIGGSIGVNCHGWAHEFGAISSTVESLEIIDANGELVRLNRDDERFKCMFGTFGYFGIIVSATLRVADNEQLIQKGVEIDIDQFHDHYQTKVKGRDIPLFGGRLALDNIKGPPLSKVCMVTYEKDPDAPPPAPTENFSPESKWGTRIERGALKMISHLSNFSISILTGVFWAREKAQMLNGGKLTRNEALHPPINAFKMLHHSNLHTQWLQEYFVKPENLPEFIRFLGHELKDNNVRLINATIRPTPQDRVSILPYAEQDRYAVVICFSQLKSEKEMGKTQKWIERVNQYLTDRGDVYYQAYMPFATRVQFEQCYGRERVQELRRLKQQYDPDHLFGNAHTAKYFD